MALQMNLDTLDGIDEGIAKLYTEKDGKFTLDVDGHDKNDTGKIPLARLNQEIDKRKASDTALSEIADELKKDVPEEMQELIPDLPASKLIKWLRKANAEGLFSSKPAESIDSRRPGGKPPKDFNNMSPQQIMAAGYK